MLCVKSCCVRMYLFKLWSEGEREGEGTCDRVC